MSLLQRISRKKTLRTRLIIDVVRAIVRHLEKAVRFNDRTMSTRRFEHQTRFPRQIWINQETDSFQIFL